MDFFSDTEDLLRADPSKTSIVYVVGESRSHCGYCGKSGKESSVTYGMHAEYLSVYTYQTLLDRGWRRSGKWLYRPVHCKTCCQLLTIRLDVRKFKESMSQKKVRRRWRSYLAGDSKLYSGETHNHLDDCFEGGSPKRPRDIDDEGTVAQTQNAKALSQTKRQRSNLCLTSLDSLNDVESPSLRFSEILHMDHIENVCNENESERITNMISTALMNALKKMKDSGDIPDMEYPQVSVKNATNQTKMMYGRDILYSSNIALAIAGKAKGQGVSLSADEVADRLLKYLKLDSSLLFASRIGAHLNIHTKSSKVGNSVKPDQNQKIDVPEHVVHDVATHGHEFRISIVPSSDSKIPEIEFDLFRKYQTIHHGDDMESVTIESFKRFLCDSPLISVAPDSCNEIPSCGYGSFHQQYWIDDELVAVGVVDILPKCLSSKYFFWDPSKAKLSLGTLASLFEIDWIKEQSRHAPSLQYYYLGYYLHDCHRMRYKASFQPSELLCPKSYIWVEIASISNDLDNKKYPWNLHGSKHKVDEEEKLKNFEAMDNVNLMIPYPGSPVTPFRSGKVLKFGALRKMGLLRSPQSEEHLKHQIKEWMDMVGPAWKNMLYAV